MKKMLILLLALLCMVPPVFAEESCPLEFQMELSQTQFAEPGEVTVTISVTNVSGADMPGPMALYWPNGMMITEFGTPTLLADESRIWNGKWKVTTQQLNAQRVIFAVMYTCQDEHGNLYRKTLSNYASVGWNEKPAQPVVITLKGNPSTGYSWVWQFTYGSGHVNIVDETAASADETVLIGAPKKFTYVVKGVTPGDVEVCFTYARPWEQDPTMGLYNLYYCFHVDEELNVSILNTRFDW